MDAFGNVQQTWDANNSWDGSSGQPYHLTTKELDPDTDLYYFNARWYDASTGRFVSREGMLNHLLTTHAMSSFQIAHEGCCGDIRTGSRIDVASVSQQVVQRWLPYNALTHYIHAKANPVRYVDPDGYKTSGECWIEYKDCYVKCSAMPNRTKWQKLGKALCFEKCMLIYAACLAKAELSKNVDVIIGTVVICGVVYLVVLTGGGAIVLVPAAA